MPAQNDDFVEGRTPSGPGSDAAHFDRPLRIRIINRTDACGGAEVVARDQLREFIVRGHDALLLVGEKRSHLPHVIEMPSDARVPMYERTWEATLRDADVIHFHNLHGKYFSIDWITRLSQSKVVVATLHDQFLFTGGCVHTHGCDRWMYGCGNCPQVAAEPGTEPDLTAEQWSQKKSAWSACRMHVVAPARWIYDRAIRSILATNNVTLHNIPNGVDTRIFHATDKRRLRDLHGVAATEIVLLAVGQRMRTNRSKDWDLLQSAVRLLDPLMDRHATLLVVGDDGNDIAYSNIRIRFLGKVMDRDAMANLYGLADIYVHASRAETFCLAILEAMACECAVVATDVGGVEEQLNPSSATVRRGLVVPAGDPLALAHALATIAKNAEIRAAFATAAADYVAREWSLKQHIDAHLALYQRYKREAQLGSLPIIDSSELITEDRGSKSAVRQRGQRPFGRPVRT